MLRFQADRRTLVILGCYATLVVGQWLWTPSGVLGVALVVLTCINSWLCAIVAHNTVHSPVFTKKWMNKVFQVWVSCSYGFPISDYIPGHNLSHHRFTQLREDVMRTTKVRFGWNLLNLLFFFPAVTPGILRGNALYKQVMGERARAWKRQLLLETIVVWSVKGAVFLVDWRKALLYVVLPHLFANFGIVSINFLQHDGCDEGHRANHSRNFVGKWLNFVALNNGYHGIHHQTPGLHWSLLPQAHAELIHPHIHPALEQPSLPVYFFKTFIYPARREMYDGRPIEIPPHQPDLDWVQPEDREAKDDDELASSGLMA
jgi:fatty acid desaturase